MRTRFCGLLLAALLALLLAACGGKDPAQTSETETASAGQAETSSAGIPEQPKIIRVSAENCRTFDPYEANSSEEASTNGARQGSTVPGP